MVGYNKVENKMHGSWFPLSGLGNPLDHGIMLPFVLSQMHDGSNSITRKLIPASLSVARRVKNFTRAKMLGQNSWGWVPIIN